MNLKSRIRKMETGRRLRWRQYLETLSDKELEAMLEDYDEKFPLGGEWLKTLTDGELNILIEGRPGAQVTERRYYEFERQNRKTRKQIEY